MTQPDIRWKQRFQNFEKAFLFLKEIKEKNHFSPIEIAGFIKTYEFTFELGWKTIKDFLFQQGISIQFPRAVIKEGFNVQIIADGHTWLEMLDKRNELAHTYEEETAKEAVESICISYVPAIQQVYDYFKLKINE